jgi:glycosyltransferase involved in cell wall biosynthesis
MWVDVIIPAYNPGHYIDEAIKSCLSQSYRKFNIIVIDDNSSQDVHAIVSKYKSVKYIRNDKNMGPSFSRNVGIKSSSSELISLLDADDVWHQDKLLHSVRALEGNRELGMTCGNYRIMVRGRLRPPFYKKSINIDHDSLMRINYVASGSTTLRRAAVEAVGLFNEEYWISEDYDMWVRISEKYPIEYIHEILYYYRIDPGNNSLTQRVDIQTNHDSNIAEIKNMSKLRISKGSL